MSVLCEHAFCTMTDQVVDTWKNQRRPVCQYGKHSKPLNLMYILHMYRPLPIETAPHTGLAFRAISS